MTRTLGTRPVVFPGDHGGFGTRHEAFAAKLQEVISNSWRTWPLNSAATPGGEGIAYAQGPCGYWPGRARTEARAWLTAAV